MNRDTEWLLAEGGITEQDSEACKRDVWWGCDTDFYSREQQGEDSQELSSCHYCSKHMKAGVSDGPIKQQI